MVGSTDSFVDTDAVLTARCGGIDSDTLSQNETNTAPVRAILGNGDNMSEYQVSIGEYVNDIAVLSDDSFIVAGSLANAARFGVGESNETAVRAAGYDGKRSDNDAFIARFASTGEFRWVRAFPSPEGNEFGMDWIGAVSRFSDDSVVIRGEFTYEVSISDDHGDPVVLKPWNENKNLGTSGEFLARFDAQGSLLWAKQLARGGTLRSAYLQQSPKDIAVLPGDSFVVTGAFQGNVLMDPGGEYASLIQSANEAQMGYLGKYDVNGRLLWVKTFEADRLRNLSVDTGCDGHIFLSGTFDGAPDIYMGDYVVGSGGATTVNILKFSPTGELTKSLVYGVELLAGGLATFPDGSYAVAAYQPGGNRKSTVFPGTDGETMSATETDFRFVVSRVNADDTPSWSCWGTGIGSVSIDDITGMDDGSVIVSGAFNTELRLSTDGSEEIVLKAYGVGAPPYQDGFIARYLQDGTLASAYAINGVGGDADIKDMDCVRAIAWLPRSRTLVAGGQIWGDLYVDYQTENQWSPSKNSTVGGIDWYLTFFAF
jgi:hypothetical protein